MEYIKRLIKKVLQEKEYYRLKKQIKEIINVILIIKKHFNNLQRKYSKDYLNESLVRKNKYKKIYFLVTENSMNTVAGDFFSAYGLGEELKSQFCYEVDYLPKKPVNKWIDIPKDADIIISMLEDLDIRTINIPRETIVVAWVRGHINEWCTNRSIQKYDGIIATSQIAILELMKEVKEKVWGQVPLAIPKGVECQSLERDLEVSFIGNIYHITRPIVENLDLSQGFNFNFFGDLESKEYHSWKAYHHGRVKNSDIKQIYSRSKIVIEDIAPFNKGTVNLRVFEAAACGALVIANEDEALKELFGDAIIMYKDRQDLTQKIKFYLSNEKERIIQAERLENIILEQHTFKQRAVTFHHILQNHIRERVGDE